MPPSRARDPTASPFFQPSTPRVIASTPGGTRRSVKRAVEENKSTVVGASANLINAIVGSGIVGIPYAVQQAGLVAGVSLVLGCALLTEKSLRLLLETAKHSNTPSYETLCESAFGKAGFLFVTINMFIMAYGAMVSYLMIVKDTLPYVIGVQDEGMRRAILFLVSLTVMVPLSAQRDMADLAKTSRLSVIFDIIMVLLVVYTAPVQQSVQSVGGFGELLSTSTVKIDTVFVGLGVLSFAFVCQHSAFIIAGSLDNPTNARWAQVTHRALCVCAALATLCGLGGYLGYLDDTKGNILNNLDLNSFIGNLARGLLGTTMLFVYPMESFVARHVCVVLFFKGRRAHEGDDSSVLNRRDRRLTLTIALYFLAVVPAIVFENLGNVLSVTGAIGGSCLSYIGPGAVYLGVHGADFLDMVQGYWHSYNNTDATATLENNMTEVRPILAGDRELSPPPPPPPPQDSWYTKCFKTILWYLLLMPFWCFFARWGAEQTKEHERELALKSPHLSRIGGNSKSAHHNIKRIGSLPTVVPPPVPVSYQQQGPKIVQLQQQQPKLARRAERQQEEQEEDIKIVPTLADFVVAVLYMILGVVALCAGLVSIYVAG